MKQRPMKDPAEIPLPPIADNPKFQAASAELEKIQQRIAEATRRREVAQARLGGQKPTTSMADRAKALVQGGSIVSLPAEAEWVGATEELDVLNAARIAQCEKLAAVVGEISSEACKRFAALNADAMRSALEAASALFQSLEVSRVIRGRLIAGGYLLNETALPVHNFPAAAALGDPDRVGMTQANHFKQWLQTKGII